MRQIDYARVGDGEPLVLIHGIGHRREAWDPVIPLLARTYDVIAVDLPGFGRSPGLPAGTTYDMATTLGNFEKLFADLGVDRPHVVGNSLGGAIALELADRGLVSTATALSPGGFFTPFGRAYALAVLASIRGAARLPRAVHTRVARNPRARAAAMASLYAHPGRLTEEAFLGDTESLREAVAFGATLRAARRYTYRGTPKVPTTIAWGTKDRILLPGQARRARRFLPGVTHVPLPGCGHVPMLDAPEVVARVVRERTGADTPAD